MTNQTNNQTRKSNLKRLQKRLLLSAAVWLGFCFTFLFFGPLELTAFSADSLVFTWRDAIGPLALVFLVTWLAATVLTVLPEMLREFGNYRMLIYSIVLILVMLVSNNPMLQSMLEGLRNKFFKKGEKEGEQA